MQTQDNLANLQTLRDETTDLKVSLSIYTDISDEQRAKLWDSEKRAMKLANSMGFTGVDEAQSFFNNIPEKMSYRQLAARVQVLERILAQERDENEKLHTQIQHLRTTQSDRGGSSFSTTDATHHASVLKQLQDLQHRYDQLLLAKQRAEDRYKADYRKFEAFKRFLRSEETQAMENRLREETPNLTPEERKARRAEINSTKAKKIQQLEAAERDETIPTSTTAMVLEQNKENQKTPVPESPRCSLVRPPSQSNPKAQYTSANANPLARIKAAPSTSTATAGRAQKQPTIDAPIDGPIILISSSSDVEEDPIKAAKIEAASPSQPVEASQNPYDTEDDSQDPCPLIKPLLAPVHVSEPQPTQEDHKHTPVINSPAPVINSASTRKQDRKPTTALILIAIPTSSPQSVAQTNALPASPSFLSVDEHLKTMLRGGADAPASHADADGEPPLKMRRLGSRPNSAISRDASMDKPGSASTPLYVASGDTPPKTNRDTSSSTERRVKPSATDKIKQKQKAVTPVSNTHASTSKQLTDYSAFKGRGRYARSGATEDSAINAQFVIDPARNGGKDFQYDEVVRGREDRRHLEAGDCECCRDYYEAIGPMPPRLKPPLWRTPPSSPGGSKPCLQNGYTPKENADIASHKQSVSRHRHQWARAKTPPAYWSIGFPSTQEAADINERAQEMHKEKEAMVQEEASREGGRYKKR